MSSFESYPQVLCGALSGIVIPNSCQFPYTSCATPKRLT